VTHDRPREDLVPGVYLADSYVLAISDRPGRLSFQLEAVLTLNHPAFHDPHPDEQHCYARGDLVFDDTTATEWIRRSPTRFVDAAGEVDLGNIDSLISDGDTYLAEGDWGSVRIHTRTAPRFELSGRPAPG
jgi:hypothetical protein